jgi:hypothetical protein
MRLATIVLATIVCASTAAADDEVAPVRSDALHDELGEYRTPRAGEGFDTVLFGTPVTVPPRDRRTTHAIALGMLYNTPAIGELPYVPFAAYFANLYRDRWRLRVVASGLVNEADVAYGLIGGLEALGHVENSTIPFYTTEIVDGRSLDFTELRWGYTALYPGLGWRVPVPPWDLDNDLRVEVFYQARYYYFASSHVTDPSLNTPPDTYAHGVRGRIRLDMVERNLFEMPHAGFALGADLELVRRDVWEDHGPIGPDGERQFTERDTRDYGRIGGYLLGAFGLPFLSERHRLVAQVHAGWGPRKRLDRFSAFRIGGGPQPTESSDLVRSPYPGAAFDQFFALDGVVTTLEYRLELLFFVYLHLRATYAWGRIPTYHNTTGPPGQVRFVQRGGTSVSAGVTSGFLWDSSFYVEYAYDTGTVRGGEDGHTALVVWSKGF